jgi:hypothetical protein
MSRRRNEQPPEGHPLPLEPGQFRWSPEAADWVPDDEPPAVPAAMLPPATTPEVTDDAAV